MGGSFWVEGFDDGDVVVWCVVVKGVWDRVLRAKDRWVPFLFFLIFISDKISLRGTNKPNRRQKTIGSFWLVGFWWWDAIWLRFVAEWGCVLCVHVHVLVCTCAREYVLQSPFKSWRVSYISAINKHQTVELINGPQILFRKRKLEKWLLVVLIYECP